MIKKAIIKKVLNLLLLIYYSNLKNTIVLIIIKRTKIKKKHIKNTPSKLITNF